MSTIVSLRHVTKMFGTEPISLNAAVETESQTGQIVALDDVNLTTRPGEVLGILGPSGCGKSTLLRVTAGLESPTSGEVFYDNVPLEEIPMSERGIGMVFQTYALYPHMPSIENIGFFLRLRNREPEIPERVREISSMMQIGLGPILSRKPPTLSGGERQRVAIARCLARDPRVFLFDEPFSNLDAKLRTSARTELKRLLQKYQVTSIYVTHDQLEATALCDRIAIMNHGKLVQVGTFRQLYDMPVNLFVAGFLGSPAMNLFHGTVKDGHWVGKSFTWGPVRRDLADETPLVLGIRPEYVEVGAAGGLEGRIEYIEPLYSERVQIIHVLVDNQKIAARVTLEQALKPGQRTQLVIDSEHVQFFDTVSGQRLG